MIYEDYKLLCRSMEEADGVFFFDISVYCTCKHSGVRIAHLYVYGEGRMPPWKEVCIV